MTHPTGCPDPRTLADLLGGRLPLSEVDRLAAHLESCPDCGREAGRAGADDPLAGLVRGLSAAPGGADDPAVARLIDTVRGFVRTVASTRTEPASEPDRVGGYRVIRRLGAGGMGVVYLARQAFPDRPVALKVLAGPRAEGGWAARFRAEAEAAARLAHPHIVPVYEAGEDAGRLYLAMELAAGTLAGRLAEAPLPPREAAGLVARLARAAAYAHARGVVHRDLKPSNVLLAADGTPKVSDFGLAKLADPAGGAVARTETGVLLGTPAYMAPEQAAADRTVGPAADVYGLGAVLYECLAGRPPFKAATVLETLDQVRHQEPVPVRRLQPAVPRDLETVCLRCLEKEPGRRYGSAAELADDLDRFGRGEPVRARPVGPLRRLAKWTRRRPTAAALVGVCVAAAVALAAVVGVYTARLREEAERADRGRAEAAANYRASRDAINRIVARLDAGRAAGVPGLGELARDQLEDALAFYRGVLSEQADPDPEVRLDAGRAWAAAGSLQFALGRPDTARDYLRTAVGLLEGLPPEYRGRPECRAALSHALNHLAQLTAAPGDDEAEGYFLRALAEDEAAVRDAPGDPAARTTLARGEVNLGLLYFGRGALDRAEAHLGRAAAIGAELVAGRPGDSTLRVDAAGVQVNLGLLYGATDRPGPAAAAYARAEELARPAVDAAGPRADEATLTLAGAYVNWGNLLFGRGDRAGGLAKLDRAVELADAALAREPAHRDAREKAFAAHGARSQALTALGRHAAAAVDLDRVVELAPADRRPPLRVLRAVTRSQAGEPLRAAAEALELAPAEDGDALYNLACVLALAARQAGNDPGPLGALAGQAAADVYGAAAVRHLGRLRAAGYFADPARVLHLAADPDLAALRNRTDFRALLAALTGKSRP